MTAHAGPRVIGDRGHVGGQQASRQEGGQGPIPFAAASLSTHLVTAQERQRQNRVAVPSKGCCWPFSGVQAE
jgi:hypothetical protein